MNGCFPYSEYHYFWVICTASDPVASTLKQRRKTKPGENSEYSNYSANLLGYAIAKTTKMNLDKLAEKYLFTPLGIHSHTWAKDFSGNTVCAGDLFLCPRDFAKIGKLMLQNGMLDGKQILSNDWIKESTTKMTTIKDFPSDLEYGYLWWIDNKHLPGAFFALGSGGQILYISPADNIVVVATSTLSGDWAITLNMIRKVIKTINQKEIESRAMAKKGLDKQTYNSSTMPASKQASIG